MELGPLLPDDANEMNRLARENGQAPFVFTPGAHGVVVRDGNTIRGFCLLRETGSGFVVDELWCDRSRAGVGSIGMLADWLESTIRGISRERGALVKLGGIVRIDNPRHRAALEKRGFKPIATVLVKEYEPWVV
jgi:hypothetical protein